MKTRDKPQAGTYVTELQSVSKRCEHCGLTVEDLITATGLAPGTVRRADRGGPSNMKTLSKIADHLGVDHWSYFLDAEVHGDLKRDSMAFIDAVGHGEEFESLRQIGSEKMVAESFAHPRVKKMARKLLGLCKETGQDPAVGLQALWQHHIVAANYQVALGVARTMKLKAKSPATRAHAYRAVGECYFYLGRFDQSLNHLLDESISNFTRDEDWEEPLALDTKVAALGHAAIALVVTGRLNEGRGTAEAAIERAEAMNHSPSIVFAYHCQAVVYALLKEPEDAERCCQRVLQETSHGPFPLFESLARLILAWAQVQLGQRVNKRVPFEAFADSRRIFTRVSRSLWLGLLIDCLVKWQDYPFASHLLDDAFESEHETGDAFFAVEIRRLMGCVHHAQGKQLHADAVKHLKSALSLAEKQHAFFYQLRAAIDLSEQATNQADRTLARRTLRAALREIDGESFDTKAGLKTLGEPTPKRRRRK